jgi:hypothetical protein
MKTYLTPTESAIISRRNYSHRTNVDWYDEGMGNPPGHNQKHRITRKYWNALRGEWCSKKSRKTPGAGQAVTMVDFSSVTQTKILERFGVINSRKVSLFITVLMRTHLGRDGVSDWKFHYMDNRTLKTYLGYRWEELVKQLVRMRIIKVRSAASKYNAEKTCLYFRLSRDFMWTRHEWPAETSIQDPKYARSIIHHYSRTVADRDPVLQHVEKGLNAGRLEIPVPERRFMEWWKLQLEKMRDRVYGSDITDRERKRIERVLRQPDAFRAIHHRIFNAYLEHLHPARTVMGDVERRFQYDIRRNHFTQGISHYLTGLPADMRKYIRMGDEPAVEVRIRSSLPAFLYVLLHKWKNQPSNFGMSQQIPKGYLTRFEQAREAGKDMYAFMAEQMMGRDSINDPEARKEMHRLFSNIVFGKLNTGNEGPAMTALVSSLFGREFIVFLKQFKKLSTGLPMNFYHKNFYTLLHREVSEFMQDVMERAMRAGILFIPMFDTMIVKNSQVRQMQDVFQAAMKAKGLDKVLLLR